MPTLEIKDLTKSFSERIILKNFSLTVPQNDRICLMGPSGCGKTTLLRLIAGLEKADSGYIMGINRKRLSFLFQEDRLLTYLSAAENCALVLNGQDAAERSASALFALGLGDSIKQKVSSLSGGMARRVALARALLYESDLILLDEPFKGLDELSKQAACDFINFETKKRTLICVTHEKKDAAFLNARIINLTNP